MPARSKGPRLYFRKRNGRQPVWIIIDGQRHISTRCGPEDCSNAEKALARYIAGKYKPLARSEDPEVVPIARVLADYGTEHAPFLAHPQLVSIHLAHLLRFFGKHHCSFVCGSTCREYVRRRSAGELGGRRVTIATARRELETLGAALNLAFKEKRLRYPVPITLPPKAPPRERWLSRSEAACLILGALGFEVTAYDRYSHRPILWQRHSRPLYHVARFILLGLYTGTRHEAILQLRWSANSLGGWVDLERKVLYRKGAGQVETSKRRTPAPVPQRLLPHLHRWHGITAAGPVEYDGRLIKKLKRGWHSARMRAGLDKHITPHVLRHTCATWLLQRGVTTWEVAGYLGTSEKVIRDIYGHHSPNHLENASRAFSR